MMHDMERVVLCAHVQLGEISPCAANRIKRPALAIGSSFAEKRWHPDWTDAFERFLAAEG